MTDIERQFLIEALRSAKRELEEMEETYDDYVVTGHLMDQIDAAIAILGGNTHEQRD